MGIPVWSSGPEWWWCVISVALLGPWISMICSPSNKALELISESAPPLTYMVGATANGGRKTYNLEELPHLPDAGTTDLGKCGSSSRL